MIRGIAGSFVVMLLVKSQISPTRQQAHTEQPRVRPRNAPKDVNNDGEQQYQNRHVTISNFTQWKIQKNVIGHDLFYGDGKGSDVSG